MYYVIQTYPRPCASSRVHVEQQFENFDEADRYARLENMGRDYSTVRVFTLVNGLYVDRFNRPLRFAEVEDDET